MQKEQKKKPSSHRAYGKRKYDTHLFFCLALCRAVFVCLHTPRRRWRNNTLLQVPSADVQSVLCISLPLSINDTHKDRGLHRRVTENVLQRFFYPHNFDRRKKSFTVVCLANNHRSSKIGNGGLYTIARSTLHISPPPLYDTMHLCQHRLTVVNYTQKTRSHLGI